MTINNPLASALVYLVYLDTSNPGWAYRLRFADGRQENGEVEGDALDALKRLVEREGGAYAGLGRGGDVAYSDHGGQESYRWEA